MYNYEDYEIQYPYILWKITHHLNIARNFLKNKPWKQSQVMTQELKYQAELVKAFIYFCGYLGWIGMDSKEVFYIYFKRITLICSVKSRSINMNIVKSNRPVDAWEQILEIFG